LKRLADDYDLKVDPDAVTEDLPVGLQQRVEILKALFRGADVLILDEPTGVLTPAEADHLFRILKVLRDEGKTVLLITHKLREIMAVTDEVSVMRRGEIVATRETSKTSMGELAELMVGRRVLLEVEKRPAEPGRPVLVVDRLTVRDGRGVDVVKEVGVARGGGRHPQGAFGARNGRRNDRRPCRARAGCGGNARAWPCPCARGPSPHGARHPLL
jgi:simple sugar transport system ATP-binding protein